MREFIYRLLLVAAAICFTIGIVKLARAAEDAKPATAPVEKSIGLTPDEEKDVEIAQLKAQNLELQIEKLQNQVSAARENSNREIKELVDKLAKAHTVDLAKFRLDMQAKKFVPVDAPTAGSPAGGVTSVPMKHPNLHPIPPTPAKATTKK